MTNVYDPANRFIPSHVLHEAYTRYPDSFSRWAPNFVDLGDGLELGIVSTTSPPIALAVSSLLTRSLEQARCDRGGHLPPEVVKRVQCEIIAPDKVDAVWGQTGHRFVLTRAMGNGTHELLATILVAGSKDTIFFLTGRYNNLRYSTIAARVDLLQLDTPGGSPFHRWFDRFALPDLTHFKPKAYHHIANFAVGVDQRLHGLSRLLLDSIVRHYSLDYMTTNDLPIVHSQHLLCGRGFWQIGDPPWLVKMQKLGFFKRWGAESFFIEHDWAPLPQVVMDGKILDNMTHNRAYDLPACYDASNAPHPSNEHLLHRVPEVLRLVDDPRAKLQYFQAMKDFV